ncbi:uncharacterized protein GGS22DRAFT_24428 [Annulohypoxylon maeteangense]|uniref:uncharacterized protein n=1 Tax=Annulohypoxylon maeteangense TaxID=1927788 RepID=UPI0020083FDB|nr:uncharacterized protein GGS22DRAFT_24428 [Annulohypoxylon maeteangense]KAI0883687.1 hypothetical protein GGS22DRAFT_24428 [Annulohypoxylon maeteangense]
MPRSSDAVLLIVWLAYHIIWQIIAARMRDAIVAVPESYSIGILTVEGFGCGFEEGRSFAAYIDGPRLMYLHLCTPRNTRLRNVSFSIYRVHSSESRHIPRKRAIWKALIFCFMAGLCRALQSRTLLVQLGWIRDVCRKRKPARII